MEPTVVRKLPSTMPLNFFKEVIVELKKVTWPTREETIRYTAVVFAISIIVGVFIGGLDVLFVRLTSILFKR
ncbi:preprotein translocase subunit SecE [Candidatus Gottesmanbacteria bacterium]|nr:preprotein translocase subunit SecE [Candidatus Gottesmanbacteria bacterium]